MNKVENHLVKRIKTLFDEWQAYTQQFEEEKQKFEETKEEMVKKVKDDPSLFETDFKKEFEYLVVEQNIKLQDLNQISAELRHIYKFADSQELAEEFDVETNKILQKLKDNERKLFFLPSKNGLVERVKGTKDQEVDKLVNSPGYKQVLKMVSQAL